MTSENFTPGQPVDGLVCEGRSGCGSTDIVYVGPDDELPSVGEFRCANPHHRSGRTFCRYYSDARPTRAETESDSARAYYDALSYGTPPTRRGRETVLRGVRIEAGA